WQTDYSTYDDDVNGTGYNTISVGVISENTFVALIKQNSSPAYYIVGYANADSAQGRLGTFPYAESFVEQWISGFDQVPLEQANDLAATPDSLIYIANNDEAFGRSILVFKMTADSVI